MKKSLAISALVLSSTCLASAQSTEPQTRDTTSAHHNWGWIGLVGLAGLMGLRPRKSEAAERFESRGVNVKSV